MVSFPRRPVVGASRPIVWSLAFGLFLTALLPTAAPASGDDEPVGSSDESSAALAPPTGVAERLLAAVDDPRVVVRAEAALASHPEIAAARARVAALEQRAPQVEALPDPMLSGTAFLAPPETRVGPQRLSLAVTQALPWASTRDALGDAARAEAAAARARLEALALERVTEIRRLIHELDQLERRRVVVAELATHLRQHEELARTRYAAGRGESPGVVKLQAEITRAEEDLLEIETRRVELSARLREAVGSPVDARTADATDAIDAALAPPDDSWKQTGSGPSTEAMSSPARALPPLAALVEEARRHRPELAAARAEVEAARARVRRARDEERPELRLGASWTLVEERRDAPGRLNPPPGNGDDVFALTGSVTLPVRRGRIEAAVKEAEGRLAEAEERLRRQDDRVRREVEAAAGRLPLLARRLETVAGLLVLQAEEAVDAAGAGYAAGTTGVLDLYEAEHLLFTVRLDEVRLATELNLAVTDLEAAVAAPLDELVEASAAATGETP